MDFSGRLPIGTFLMLGFGFAGEDGSFDRWVGLVFSVAGWAYMLYDILLCETGGWRKLLGGSQNAFSYMRITITAGWSIYPLGTTTKASWDGR